jgi:hypothetical protein
MGSSHEAENDRFSSARFLARFIQRHVMMRRFIFSVKKMQACVGSWLTSVVARPFRGPRIFEFRLPTDCVEKLEFSD